MDLTNYTTTELEDILRRLPAEITRREAKDQPEDDDEAKRRKMSVWASMQELAKKQGFDLDKL